MTTKRTVSPCLTLMSAGVKRIESVMSTWTVRVTLAATPGLPTAASASWPWPPAWVPEAKAPAAASAAPAAKTVLRKVCVMVSLEVAGMPRL
ncbi:hypothetical protein D9M69_615420 [compost metagenome]